MNLQEFVSNVLVSLDKAVDIARGEMKRDVRFVDTKDQRTVEFDIAVSVEEIDAKSGKAGIKVLQFVEGSGDISKESKNSTVSRIKFGIRIDQLTKEEDAAQDAVIRNMNENNRNRFG